MFLETERLILKTWAREDWTDLQPLATDPAVMRYITGGVSWPEEKIRGFVDAQIRLCSDLGFCRWKLVEKNSGEFVGFCGAGFWRDYPDPEIGWWLAPRCWGQGLATEAGRAALDDVFERVQLRRVVSVAHRENTASRKVMQKLGLRLECEFECDGLPLVRYETDCARRRALG